MTHSFQVFVHVVLFALWSTGYLVIWLLVERAGKVADQAAQDQLTKAAQLVEIIAKTAFILMLPMGLQLVENMGIMALPGMGAAGVWIFTAVWLFIVWQASRSRNDPKSRGIRTAERIVELVFAVLIAGAGILSFMNGSPTSEGWLAAKLIFYALALGVMQIVDESLASLFRAGADAAVAQRKRIALSVPLIMLFALAAAYIGVAKP